MATTEMIESRIDKATAGQLRVTSTDGGASFANMVEVMEFSKIMAVSGVALPAFLRNNPGACMAICLQAIEWRMSPFAVANKAYVVNDRVAYESQLIHAVIEQRAPLVGRLRHAFTGSGQTRRCTVIGRIHGESEPLEYTSPEFKDITPKNSPLWKTKPDLQLYYNASRDWARMYFPDVILGVYSDDEIEAAHGSYSVRNVEPVSVDAVTARLERVFGGGPQEAESSVDNAPEAKTEAAPEWQEKLQSATTPDAVATIKAEFDPKCKSPEQYHALVAACEQRQAELKGGE